MSESAAAPLPRAGQVFFDVRGSSRTLRLSWYADTGVAVFSIWQGGRCSATFRLPLSDLPRMVEILQEGPEQPGYPHGVAGHPEAGYPAAAGYHDPVYAGYQDAGYQDGGHPQGGYPHTGYYGPGYQGASHPEAGYPEAGYPEGGYPEAGYPEGSYPEAGHPEAGHPEAGHPESGYPAADNPDATYLRAGSQDAGNLAVGYPGTGHPDAGHPDAGRHRDAGRPEAGYSQERFPNAAYPAAPPGSQQPALAAAPAYPATATWASEPGIRYPAASYPADEAPAHRAPPARHSAELSYRPGDPAVGPAQAGHQPAAAIADPASEQARYEVTGAGYGDTHQARHPGYAVATSPPGPGHRAAGHRAAGYPGPGEQPAAAPGDIGRSDSVGYSDVARRGGYAGAELASYQVSLLDHASRPAEPEPAGVPGVAAPAGDWLASPVADSRADPDSRSVKPLAERPGWPPAMPTTDQPRH